MRRKSECHAWRYGAPRKFNSLIVRGNLDISETVITVLPKISVGGSIDARFSDLKYLPEGMYVNGNFLISDTDIEVLPSNLMVDGSLAFNQTKIKKLPDNLLVSGNIYASGSALESLPDNFSLYGNLVLDYLSLDKFPSRLSVHGNLRLYKTKVGGKLITEEDLPSDLVVTRNVYLTDKKMRKYGLCKLLRENEPFDDVATVETT